MAKNVIINGVTYPDVPYVDIPLAAGGGDTTFYDTSDATATSSDILSGKTAYLAGGADAGSMPNNGDVSANITSKDQQVNIPAGYASGGSVKISVGEQNKIIPSNIKSGVTILGVNGLATVKDVSDTTATAATVLDGYDFYTASGTKVGGSLTVPSVTQNPVSKSLRVF